MDALHRDECTKTSTCGLGDGIAGTSAERSLIAIASRPGPERVRAQRRVDERELVAQDAVLVERLDRVEVGEDLLAQRRSAASLVRGAGSWRSSK